MKDNKLSIDSIGDIAVGIGIAVIAVAIVAMMLANFFIATYVDITKSNTTFDNSTTLTVSHGLKSWAVYNDTTQAYGSLPATNYTINTTTGFLNVTDSDARVGTESVNYMYSGDSNATSIVSKGLIAIGSFADWFIILIVVVIAVIVLALLQYLRGRGGVGGGRA